MGVVVRPEAFAIAVRPRAVAAKKRRRRWIDSRVAALIVMAGGLAWILALAGAAFTIRMVLVLVIAVLAGRTRKIGLPGRTA